MPWPALSNVPQVCREDGFSPYRAHRPQPAQPRICRFRSQHGMGDTITYLKVGRKWHYLTVFIDLFSRIVVGWGLSDSLERHSAIRGRPSKGLLVHSDRGIQFASCDFRAALKRHGCIQSMSRKGNCWDNAVAESFFRTLKTQLVWHRRFTDFHEAGWLYFNTLKPITIEDGGIPRMVGCRLLNSKNVRP